MNIRRLDGLVHAAANGLEVWMSYAVVEYLFSAAAPLLIHRDKVLDESRWRGTVILLGCYAVWGLLMGLLAGISMDGARGLPLVEFDRRSRKLLVLLVVAAFGINLAFLPAQPGKVAALLVIPLVAVAVIFDAGKSDSNPGLYRGLSGFPAAVAVVLIVTARLAFVNWKSLPAVFTVPLTLLAAVTSLLAAVVAIRLVFRVRSSRLWSPVLRHGMIAATVIGMVFGPDAVSYVIAEIRMPFPHPATGKPLPNIILISMDTVRADHMGIYGYARQNTPNLKELLKESTLYTNSIAASTITLTSHASMFTGLYPGSHGAYKQFPGFPLGRPLSEGIPTIASLLDLAGYRTMALAANLWYLGSEFGLLHGFEYSWTPRPMPLIEANHAYLLRGRIGQLLQDLPDAADFYSSPAIDAATITRRATLLLDRFRGQQTPFFLFLNFMDAHWPYRSPSPFDATYPGRDFRFNGSDEEAALRNRVDCGGESVPSVYQAHAESQYDGAIAFLDFKIGEMVDYLKRNGLFERTMIIITSDHGEALGNRGFLAHNVSVYQDQVHVPLIVKYPGSRGSGRVEDLVSHVDILPTILDVAGLAPRPDLPGVSLLRLNSKSDRAIFSERHYGSCQAQSARTPGVQYALFRGSSKLISSSLGVQELYDLANDPSEKTDLYRTESPQALESTLQDWIRSTPRLRAAQQPVDREQMKRLRSLGYLQ
jgi:arylsulfatase A-like enzyme